MVNEDVLKLQQDSIELFEQGPLELQSEFSDEDAEKFMDENQELFESLAEAEKADGEPYDEIDQFIDSVPEVKPAAEDMGAAFIERHIAAVEGYLSILGKNALKRIILNVMSGPEFSKRDYKPVTKAETAVASHFDECVQLRARIVFNEEFKKLSEAYEKEQDDLKKIDELTNQALTPEAKQMLEEHLNKNEENNERKS